MIAPDSSAQRAQQAVFDRAPEVAAAAAFLFGAVALVAAVTSASPPIPGLKPLETIADEWPEFTASIAAVALMSLALGLRRRLDGAWAGATALLAFLGCYALLRHDHYAAGLACLAGAAALLACRRAFYRHAGPVALLPSRTLYLWIVAALAVAGVGAVLWAAERPGFAEAPWWTLFGDVHIGRAGRIEAAAVLALAAIAAWSLLVAPARRNPATPAPEALARVEHLIAESDAQRPEAQLAFLGDKSFVFGEGAAVMAARAGASFVAMGAPLGPRARWRRALAAFREEADRLGLRPVIYAAPPELLPDLIEIGFRIEKIGENAIIELRSFSLSGSRRQNLRTARRKLAERDAATFEIEPAPEAPHIAALRPLSDAWLAMHKGGEKSFSLGRFDPAFMARGPLAVVRIHGRAVAFATLWTTQDKSWAAIDLMRYDPNVAPPGTMDFLIAEALLWAQREGYGHFDLGMAPLSGLSEERHAPLFARFGRLIYERGGPFYNFEGLRKFKEKFAPDWEPRYLAAPGSWSMPIVLAEIALMTSRA